MAHLLVRHPFHHNTSSRPKPYIKHAQHLIILSVRSFHSLIRTGRLRELTSQTRAQVSIDPRRLSLRQCLYTFHCLAALPLHLLHVFACIDPRRLSQRQCLCTFHSLEALPLPGNSGKQVQNQNFWPQVVPRIGEGDLYEMFIAVYTSENSEHWSTLMQLKQMQTKLLLEN